MPPPVPELPSFHTVSAVMAPFDTVMFVPPQPLAQGLEAGKSTCAFPSLTPSVARLSPAATKTDTLTEAASWSALVIVCIACAVQLDSGPPQLIEMTDGPLVESWVAVVTASTKPASVFGVK